MTSQYFIIIHKTKRVAEIKSTTRFSLAAYFEMITLAGVLTAVLQKVSSLRESSCEEFLRLA